jgi:hypothetical protein
VWWLNTNISEDHVASICTATLNMEAARSEPHYTAQQPRKPQILLHILTAVKTSKVKVKSLSFNYVEV